ncbi:hypothetical protein, partial [Lederbergia ruris]|uniref:hypothetical protein n=1 Tax=Lederbergia ruris TaxID=217495 RepID=UPI001BB331B2
LPENRIINVDHFNETLWEMAEKDRDRLHYDKKILQSKLFEEEFESSICGQKFSPFNFVSTLILSGFSKVDYFSIFKNRTALLK